MTTYIIDALTEELIESRYVCEEDDLFYLIEELNKKYGNVLVTIKADVVTIGISRDL